MIAAHWGMALWTALVCTGVGLTKPAFAEKVIWHYDSLPSVMDDLATGMKQHPMYAHPGFVKGEGWGVLFKPKAEDYPVKILTVEFVMAQADGVQPQKGDFAIEFYNDDGVGPAPKGAPIWSITTKDFANGGNIGQPVVGNTGMVYQFDWSKPENHPPLIDKGNIYLVIRYLGESQSLETMWGKLECTKVSLGAGLDLCGCQPLAALTEQKATIKGVNLMNIVWPIGTCAGAKQWKFVEQVSTTNLDMKGNFILRMGVDGTAPVNPADAGSTGGDTSAPDSGSTQTDAGSIVKDTFVPVQPPEITGITPAFGPVDKPVSVDIYGKNFQKGLVAKLGTEAIKVQEDTVTPTGFSAVVIGVPAGTYDLVVKNPDGQVAFKTAAYTVKPAEVADVQMDVQPDVQQTETAPEVTALPEVTPEAASAGPFSIETVAPACVENRQDAQLVVYGTGFVKGLELKVGTTPLAAVDVVSSGKATGLLPKDVAPGTYSVFGSLPGGEQKALANAIRVATNCSPAVVGSPASSSCTAGARGNPWLAGLLGLVFALVAGWRLRPAMQCVRRRG